MGQPSGTHLFTYKWPCEIESTRVLEVFKDASISTYVTRRSKVISFLTVSMFLRVTVLFGGTSRTSSPRFLRLLLSSRGGPGWHSHWSNEMTTAVDLRFSVFNDQKLQSFSRNSLMSPLPRIYRNPSHRKMSEFNTTYDCVRFL